MFCVSDVIALVEYEKYFEKALQTYSIAMLSNQNKRFQNFLSSRYATEVCFQQPLCPTGTKKAQTYYSGKRKLNGYKLECSVLPKDLAIKCTKLARGGQNDLKTFCNEQEFSFTSFRKARR